MKKEEEDLARVLVDMFMKQSKIILCEELTTQYNKGYNQALEDVKKKVNDNRLFRRYEYEAIERYIIELKKSEVRDD